MSEKITLISPRKGAVLPLTTAAQHEFMVREFAGLHDNKDCYSWIDEEFGRDFGGNYADNPDEVNLTAPRTVRFEWRSDIPSHPIISLFPDFGEHDSPFPNSPEIGELVYLGTDERGISAVEVGDLFARTTYYWKVAAIDGSCESEVRSFTTADEFPRAIFAQGSANIRDIGGLPVYGGGHVRQGCLYRGGTIDARFEDRTYDLTERGKRVLRDIVKIKTELEIRREAIGVISDSVIGADYLQIPGRGYDLYFEDENAKYMKAHYELFADAARYPIYIHCLGGADRTATMFFVLEALLGVPWRYIKADYNITSLTISGKRCCEKGNVFECFYRVFLGKAGRLDFHNGDFDDFDEDEVSAAASEGAKLYLMEHCGVSEETLERVKANLIE